MKILTGNDLRTGAVTWWNGTGWSLPLSGAQIAALSTMKQHTDFNDLAHKSELGIEGVKRQIGAAISQVQRDEQQHQEQKHVEKKQQQIEQRPRRAARIG